MTFFSRLILASLIGFWLGSAHSQIAPGRTWPELKQAVQERVNAQRYPMTGFDPKEVAEILGRIQSLDRNEWALSWIQNGDRHSQSAASLAQSQPHKAAEA